MSGPDGGLWAIMEGMVHQSSLDTIHGAVHRRYFRHAFCGKVPNYVMAYFPALRVCRLAYAASRIVAERYSLSSFYGRYAFYSGSLAIWQGDRRPREGGGTRIEARADLKDSHVGSRPDYHQTVPGNMLI